MALQQVCALLQYLLIVKWLKLWRAKGVSLLALAQRSYKKTFALYFIR
jgi:hypothetical protein